MSGKEYESYVDKKFGKLTVLEFRPGNYKNGQRIRVKAKCKCDCGVQKWINWEHLKKEKINSCGCLKDPSVTIGQKFGGFTVLEIIPHHYNEYGKRFLTKVKCECVCGTIKNINLSNLQAGNTISCGCIGRENIRQSSTKHGMSYNPIYRIWHLINNRCYNQNVKAYKNYGGRGIINYWKNDPAGFVKYILEELGPKPKPHNKYSLDRINNNGNYEPGNLRWATWKQQASNKTYAYQRKIEALQNKIKFLENKLNEHDLL